MGTLLALFVIGLVGLIILGVALTVIGGIFGVAAFLLFKVAPIVLVGYVIVRFLSPRRPRLTPAERRWLEN